MFRIERKSISAYCSSLARARQTLIEILRCIGQENVEITETDSLKEMDLGLLEGMTWEERRQKYPEVDLDKKLSILQAPCGESYQDVKNRCKMFAEKYLEKEADEKNIIIVSHGITLRILTNFLLKRPDEDINFLNIRTLESCKPLDMKNGDYLQRVINGQNNPTFRPANSS